MDAARSALQAARQQINSCASLSQGGRRREGLAAVASAQQTLQGLLADAGRMTGRQEAEWLRQEVCALQVAALLAQAIDAEQFMLPHSSGSDSIDAVASMEHEKQAFAFYAEAKKLAEMTLPASHSMVALTRHLCSQRAVCMPASRADRPVINIEGSSTQLQSKSQIEMATSSLWGRAVSDSTSLKSLSESAPSLHSTSPKASSLLRRARAPTELQLSAPVVSTSGPGSPTSPGKTSGPGSTYAGSPIGSHSGKHKSRNVFADFLAEDQMTMMKQKGFFNNRQADLQKQVRENARFTRLQNVGRSMAELTDKKFTGAGHQIQMKALLKENVSRSDQSLLSQAKTSGGAPEVLMARQLRQALEPKKAPKPVEKKPTPQETIGKSPLGAEMGSLFKKKGVVDKSMAVEKD